VPFDVSVCFSYRLRILQSPQALALGFDRAGDAVFGGAGDVDIELACGGDDLSIERQIQVFQTGRRMAIVLPKVCAENCA
jgi:hypothetical protein